MKFNQYKLVLTVCTVFWVVQSNPDNVQMNDDETVPLKWGEDQPKNHDLARSINRVHKRDVSDPVSNAGKQLSTFVSLINSAILGEAIVQNLTTFGEIGVNLMLMQNMPAGEDWISSVDPNDIVMDKMSHLQKILEDGFDGSFPVDVLKEVMIIEEGVSSLDDISNAYATIQKIIEIYPKSTVFEFYGSIIEFDFIESISRTAPILKRHSDDFKLLDSFEIGAEIIKNYSQINVEMMNKSFELCKNSMTSEECTSGLAVLRNVSFDNVIIENIEVVAAVLDLVYHASRGNGYSWLLKRKNEITSTTDSLSKLRNLITTEADYGSLQDKISKMLSSLDALKIEELKLEELTGVLEAFRPVAEAVKKMLKTYRSNPHRRINKVNKEEVVVFDSFCGLPNGIVTLNELSEITGYSTPPDRYRNSKVAERTKMMEEFTKQRVSFLKLSEGIKSVQYISLIIKNMNSYFGYSTESKILEKGLKNVLEDSIKLASIKGIDDGIKVLQEVESQIETINETQIIEVYTAVKHSFLYFKKRELYELFHPLARVIKFAKDVENLINTNGKADEKIFSETIEASKLLSRAINFNIDRLSVPSIHEIGRMENLITKLSGMDVKLNNGKVPIESIVNGLKNLDTTHEKIDEIVGKKSEHSQFAANLKKLEELKSGLPARPNQKQFADFESLMTELNYLKPLEITPALRNVTPSPHITILLKGIPYGSDILRKISKEVKDYLRLIEGVSSIEDFKNETVEAPVKELLVGADGIQVVDAKDKLSAYDVLNNSKVVEKRLRELEEYLANTYETILTKRLKSTIVKKAHMSTVHNFLNKLNQPLLASIGSLRHDIMWILKALEHAVDNDEKISTSTISNVATEKKEEVPQWMYNAVYFFSFTGVIGLIGNIVLIGVLLYRKHKKAEVSISEENLETSEESSVTTPITPSESP